VRHDREWLAGNGWKYQLVGVCLSDVSTRTPFGATAAWWKVYQIALEDPSGLVRYGWIRFGDGKVEFRFAAAGNEDALLHDPLDRSTPAQVFPPQPLAVAAGRDPLWDRWLYS
jgi:hypothetical protein